MAAEDHADKTADPIPEKGESPQMFDRIAHRYDLVNRVLTLRLDVRWRKKLAAMFPDRDNLAVLDVACGTGDVLTIGLKQRKNVSLGVGLDPAARMMARGRDKARECGLAERIAFVRGDALRLPFADGSFDVVTISFGIRNVTDVPRALAEMHRVLAPGGRVLVLEFSFPDNRALRAAYLVYLQHILPRIGAAISGDAAAYRYLDRTVESFPYGEAFCDLLRRAGFAAVRPRPLTFGVATVYSGEKK